MAEIDELLRQGKRIQAIKLHRELTGSGLSEAKEAVERRMR
ncbi:ribosomal protein L7/L12 [Streptomyces halobius]|uniref:Ribosomal protein L7/L12 n=1 Tax=Streptomyces halobius TaxID=2879846 RepID=A0ABY4MBS3_9ACTN|nr:ribosomal protein L7/L12 [Streptomyces halobius]UQA95187.1 ribosomal protein L7/L12 [Streptomyces halobius]